MYFLITQCHISQAEMVSKHWLFCLKSAHSLGRKDTMLAIMRSNTMSETLQVVFIHKRRLRRLPRSNGCVSLWHSTIFLRLIWCPNIGHFAWNLSVASIETTLCWPWVDSIRCKRLFWSSIYIYRRLLNTQGAMNICPYDTMSYFPGLYGAQIWLFCLKI